MAANEDIVQSLIVRSPYAAHLGIILETIERDHVALRLPFRPEVVTINDIVHGGALSSLVDTAATAAFWSGTEVSENPRGTTIGLTLNFLSAARGQDVVADAHVIQRGKTICVGEVQVRAADGRAVARALVTYKLG